MTQEMLDEYKRHIRMLIIEKYGQKCDREMLWALVDIAFYVQGVMIQKFEDDIEKMTAKCWKTKLLQKNIPNALKY